MGNFTTPSQKDPGVTKGPKKETSREKKIRLHRVGKVQRIQTPDERAYDLAVGAKRAETGLNYISDEDRSRIPRLISGAPVPDDEESKIANMLKFRRRYAKAGRAGTVLTEGSKLG